jgi:hypothetical protein
MADLHHLYYLNQGRDVWNKWRQENPEIQRGCTHLFTHSQYLACGPIVLI